MGKEEQEGEEGEGTLLLRGGGGAAREAEGQETSLGFYAYTSGMKGRVGR